jgi:anti-sigma regulatory factor (Ser/Thr protein kinase)
MVLTRTACYPIVDASQVGEVRRATMALANAQGFGEEDATRTGIIATELANNLFHHATGRRLLLLQRIGAADNPGIELIALDSAPGIRDAAEAFRDGYSTGGTAGEGLGAIRRLASVSDLYSSRETGTAVLARVYPRNTSGTDESVGALSIAKAGETDSGDACAWQHGADCSWFMIADGLGHGLLAAEASGAAARAFEETRSEGAVQRLQHVHSAIHGTRGCAVAIAEIPHTPGRLEYAGLGNISGVVLGDKARGLVSLHGTAGQDAPRIASFPADWPAGGVLVLHSDGLSNRWNAFTYPGLLSHHPSLIAAVLYRDSSRGKDDASILVYRPPS